MSVVYTSPHDGLPAREQQRMKQVRREAFIRQDGKCYWCGREMIWKTKENATVAWNDFLVCTGDHLIFKARGGEVTRENIVAACRECNNSRHPEPDPFVLSMRQWLYDLMNWSYRNSERSARDFFVHDPRVK